VGGAAAYLNRSAASVKCGPKAKTNLF